MNPLFELIAGAAFMGGLAGGVHCAGMCGGIVHALCAVPGGKIDLRYLIVDFDGVPVNFIDVENLKANKRPAGRLQDLADVEKLES